MNTITQLLPVLNIACLIAIYFMNCNVQSNNHKQEDLVRNMIEINSKLNEVKVLGERVNGVVWATHGDIELLIEIFYYLKDWNEEDY